MRHRHLWRIFVFALQIAEKTDYPYNNLNAMSCGREKADGNEGPQGIEGRSKTLEEKRSRPGVKDTQKLARPETTIKDYGAGKTDDRDDSR
jgi:hypothetical protein